MVKGALESFDEDDELTYENFSAAIKKNSRLENMLSGIAFPLALPGPLVLQILNHTFPLFFFWLTDQLVIPNFNGFASMVKQFFSFANHCAFCS